MEKETKKIEVFISRKSQDRYYSKKLYDFLEKHNFVVFESDETLPDIGQGEYSRQIDIALDEAEYFIIICSNTDYLNSKWVEREWRIFDSECAAGRKKNDIICLFTENFEKKNIPIRLRNLETIIFNEKELDRILAYLGRENSFEKSKGKKNLFEYKWFLPILILIGFILTISTIYFVRNFDNSKNFLNLAKTEEYNPLIHKEADIMLNPDTRLVFGDNSMKYAIAYHNRVNASAKNVEIKFFLKYEDGFEEYDYNEKVKYVPKNTEYLMLEGNIDFLIPHKKPNKIVIYLSYDNEFSPRRIMKKFVINEPKNINDNTEYEIFANESKIILENVNYFVNENPKYPEREQLRKTSIKEKNQRKYLKENYYDAISAIKLGYALYETRDWNNLSKISSEQLNNFIEKNKNYLLFEFDYGNFNVTYNPRLIFLEDNKGIFFMIPNVGSSSATYYTRYRVFQKNINLNNYNSKDMITPFKNEFEFGFEVAVIKENGKWKLDLHKNHNGLLNL